MFFSSRRKSYVTTTITAEIEAIIHRIRVRLMDHVRRSELLSVEKIGRARIVAAITSDAAVLTQASNMLSFSIQAPVLIFFVGIYVAYLSFAAFALSVIIVTFTGTLFHFRSRRLTAETHQGGGAGAPAVRSRQRLPRRLQGGQAQRRPQQSALRRRLRRLARRRQYQDP